MHDPTVAVINLSEPLARLCENLLAAVILIIGGTALFFVGKIREAIYGGIQRRLRKASRLKPATADGHRAIHELLAGLREKFGAFRVTVFQFHNGDSFMLSNHAWKVSCTHEALHPGARSALRENQNLPISAISDWVAPLLSKDTRVSGVRECLETCHSSEVCSRGRAGGRAVYYEVEQMQMSVGKAMALEQGVEHVFAVNLIDVQRQAAFGVLAIQFQDMGFEDLRAAETQMCNACAVAETVQFYLTNDFRRSVNSSLWGWLFGA